MEKYGFIYIWFDRKHKRYYIGAHWGTETDGYVCSSPWMKKAYSRRPQDFKRKILERVYSNRKQTFIAEEKYLDLIKKEEFGKKYYNLKNIKGHWSTTEEKTKSIGQKISESPLRNQRISEAMKGRQFSAEHKIKIKQAKIGKKLTEEHKKKIAESGRGKTLTQESKNKISEALTGLKRGPMSEEQKELRRTPKSEDTKLKISQSMKKRLNKRKF